MSGARHWEQDKESTLYIGNIDEKTTDAQVWELMLQCGPVVNVHLPKDRVSQEHQGYGFVEYATEDDAEYASRIMNNIMIYGKRIRVNKASADKRTGPEGGPAISNGIGAELFVRGLDTMVDEATLFDTFSRFGPLANPPKVTRDENGLSKGYGFVSFASFEASDDAIANMNGQYLMNKEIAVQYAYKKDGKAEQHGDAAERALATQARKHGVEVQIAPVPAATPVQPMAPPMMPMMNGFGAPPMAPPGGMQMPYAFAPSPAQAMPFAPPAQRSFSQAPLQPASASAGLPARPPSGAYGGPPPPNMPPGFPPSARGMPPPGFSHQYPPPQS